MTLKEILEAVSNLSEDDRRSLHQTLGDRIDESVAAQEKDDHDEDSQDAKDRIDESIGEEEHLEEEHEKKEEEHEGVSDEEEKAEKADEEKSEPAASDGTVAALGRIEALLIKLLAGKAAEDKGEAVEAHAKEIYGLGQGTFTPEREGKGTDKVDVRKTLRNLGL